VTLVDERPATEAALRRQIGRHLHIRRTWLELTQSEVAQRAKVTRNFVSAIERGVQGLDAWRLWAVAEALGVTLDWLLAGPDERLTAPASARPSRVGSVRDG
jgi:transcriptional regulator with XRE-family HTH domain